MRRAAILSLHTSPLTQPGTGDSGGMNVYVRELAAGLAHRGVDCRVYVRTAGDQHDGTIVVEPGLRVVHVPAGRRDLRKEALPGIVDGWAERVGDDLARIGGADVLHANYWLSGVAGHRLKHRLDIPLVATFHTLARVKALHGDPEPEARAVAEQAVVGCADMVLASCDAEAAQLVEHYAARPERVAVVPPGVEHALFSPGPSAGARAAVANLDLGSDPVVLFVGRIQALKGLDLAVDALGCSRHRNGVLVVVGGPSGVEGAQALADVRARIAAAKLTDRVRFLDPQPHHLLSTLYRAANVVVVPSRSESFGLVALESAACGVPVVASDVGGLATVVDPGRTGFLVGSRDANDYARAIDSVLGDPLAAASLGTAAADRAARFTWAAAAARLDEVIERVVRGALVDCAA